MKILHLSYNDISDGASRAAYRIHKSLQYSNIDSSMIVIEKKSDDFSVTNSTKKFNRILQRYRLFNTCFPLRVISECSCGIYALLYSCAVK